MLNIGLEVQQQIRAANGDIIWAGAQVIANSFVIQVAAANTGPGIGEAVQWDATNSVIPRPATNPTETDHPMSVALYGVQSPAGAASINLIGVAQEPIAAGKRGLVAGDGSIVCVKSTAGAIAVGKTVQSSATAGTVEVGAPSATGLNIILGVVLKTNTVAAPGTGSTGWLGIKVQGGSAAVS